MLQIRKDNAQFIYSCMHFLYLMTYALMFAYAATYMQDKGFTNTEIGIVLGCTFVLASVLQVVFEKLFSKSNATIEKCMGIVYIFVAIMALGLLLLSLSKIIIAILLILIMAGHAALQPSLNSCIPRWGACSCGIDYGKARAIGSLAYAAISFTFGMLLKIMSPSWLPAFYIGSIVCFIIILFNIRLPEVVSIPGNEDTKSGDLSKERCTEARKHFPLILVGIVFLIFGHTLIDNYTLQILQNVGGSSSDIGIVVAVGSVAELAAMLLYTEFSKKIGDQRLLMISGIGWILKHFLAYLSQSVIAIYCVEILQFVGYGIYTPAIVAYINDIFPVKESFKWLSLSGSAYTVGAVLASFCGGFIIDSWGTSSMLLVATIMSFVGSVIFAAYIIISDRKDTSCNPVSCNK